MNTSRNLLLPLLLVLGAPAFAQSLTPLDRFSVSAGVFNSRLSLDGRIRAEGTLIGSLRSYAEDFDLGSRRTVGMAELSWSPFQRHELSLRYSRDSYQRGGTLSDQIRFEGEVFPIDAELTARARFTSVEFDYTWWMVATDASAFGVQLGALRYEASLSLSGSVSGEGGTARLDADAKRQLHAPLIGIAGRHLFSDRLRGFAELRAIKLDYEQIEGAAMSATIGLEYYFSDHMGVVLQYADTRVRADRRISGSNDFGEGQLEGRLGLGLSGAQAMLKVRF
ncbi:MAG: hypothetical protein ACT4NL_05980 [Pseudomarimonas sp.]